VNIDPDRQQCHLQQQKVGDSPTELEWTSQAFENLDLEGTDSVGALRKPRAEARTELNMELEGRGGGHREILKEAGIHYVNFDMVQ
jgi:hypothetical protein